eukprot:400672-Prymnesium_polylepis.1
MGGQMGSHGRPRGRAHLLEEEGGLLDALLQHVRRVVDGVVDEEEQHQHQVLDAQRDERLTHGGG